ncbi:hypothetical protein ACI2LJ_27685 [Streptomyces sp. NPDC088090]|uniref:hypothetical protein n=1 Tax=Streptomyces sp. NPDC088090 TaxID=3365822 RepID=UPI00384CD1D3
MTGPSSNPRPHVDQLTDDMLDQLYAERDTYRDAWHSAKDRVRKHNTRAELAEADRDGWRERAQGYQAAIARVRALHEQYRFGGDETTDYCAHCNQISGGWVPYPCPTLRALDGTA